jgi:AcrR family transcriptional regulator
MAKNKPDRRIERTRETLLRAFVSLYFERDYNSITVADIANRANVGRSTFYEHFRGKDALLAVSHRRPFASLAAIVDLNAEVESVRLILDHFWSNRGNTPSLRSLALRRALGRILSGMLFERLHVRANAANARTQLDHLRLAAVVIAESMLGTVAVWLSGEVATSSSALADTLYQQAQTTALTVCSE